MTRTRIVRAGDLLIDTGRVRVTVRGRDLNLAGLQLRLLLTLARHPGRVLSRDRLAADVWGTPAGGNLKLVDVLVCRLRRRLGPSGVLIRSIRGFGYRFDPDWKPADIPTQPD